MNDDEGYLIDTSTLSEFAPGRPPVRESIVDWITSQSDAGRLYLSVITVAEIQRGIRKLNRAGGTVRAKAIGEWLHNLIGIYGDRLLPIDAATSLIAGSLEDEANSRGVNPGFPDILIASTARAHNLKILTANTKHFQPLGLESFNPLDEIPDVDLIVRPTFNR